MSSIYVTMLSAVSKMLGENKDPKVQCAKDIVDKLVEHLDKKPVSASLMEVEGDPRQFSLDQEARVAREELLSD